MNRFPYDAYYRRVQATKALQFPADSISWTEQFRPPERSYEIVLYLGCNILRTPDIAADVKWVFDHMGLDFVAIAGVQFCCGVTWHRAGDDEQGRHVSARSIERLSAYGPRTVVFWCPSCDVHYSDVVLGRDGGEVGFQITQCTTFLAQCARRGELNFKRTVPRRVALHMHVGHDGHAAGQQRALQDNEACAAILRAIPGIEIVGFLEAPPEYDYDCGLSSNNVERERWLSIRASLLQDARKLGADTVVTISHACQREWCDAGTEHLQVRNYISLLADALGIERAYSVDTLGEYKRLANPEAIVAASRAAWSSHGLSEADARAIADGYAWDAAAPRTQAP